MHNSLIFYIVFSIIGVVFFSRQPLPNYKSPTLGLNSLFDGSLLFCFIFTWMMGVFIIAGYIVYFLTRLANGGKAL